MAAAAHDRIRVVVRVRPRARADSPSLWQYDQQRVAPLRAAQPVAAPFTFDRVFGEAATTDQVYASFAQPIALSVLTGVNATLFAYGQTATGKTHTISGTPDSPGLIPLIVRDLFAEIKQTDRPERFFPDAPEAARTSGVDFCMRVSFVEIYNEAVNDLLNPGATNLPLHSTPDGRVELECQELIVKTPAQVLDLLRRGEANRHVGATNMNERSSRSHTIFRLTLESTLSTADDGTPTFAAGAAAGDEDEQAKVAHVAVLTLVDLAGSERIAHTGAEGVRKAEAGQINKSLLALGTVINKLAEGKAGHVPYRDSKLTRLLQPSLGGNARTGVICTISLAPAHYEETLSTLKFASRAKRVENAPVVNEVQDTTTVLNDLKRQIRLLKKQLAERRTEQSEKELATLSQSIIATPARRRAPPRTAPAAQSQHQQQYQQQQQQHQQHQQQIKEYEIKLKKMQQLLDYATTRAEDAEKSASEKDGVLATMQCEMSEAVMQYEEQITKLKARVAELEQQQQQQQQQQRPQQSEDSKRVRELEEQISDLSDQLEECSQTAEALQAELSQARAAAQAAERHRAELEHRLAAAEKRADAEHRAVEDLAAQLAREPPAKRHEREQQHQQQHQQLHQQLQQQAHQLQQAQKQAERAAQEREALAQQLAAAQQQLRERDAAAAGLVQAQQRAVEQRDAAVEQWSAQHAADERRIAQLEAAQARLGEQATAQELRLAELVGRAQQHESAAAAARAALGERERECKRLQAAAAALEEQARTRYVESEAQRAELEARLEQARCAHGLVAQELAEAREVLKQRDARCAALESSLALLQKDGSSGAGAGAAADAEAEAAVADYEERVRDLETQRDELMEENVRLRRDKEALAREAKEAEARAEEQRKSEHRRWRAERMQAAAELKSTKNYVQCLEARLAEYEPGRPASSSSSNSSQQEAAQQGT